MNNCIHEITASIIDPREESAWTTENGKIVPWKGPTVYCVECGKFLEKWNKETNMSLELCNDTEFNHVWFDIISEADNKLLTSSYRFKYVYSNIDDIMKGIYNFYHTVKFVGSEKKKSRRNKS